MFKTRLALFLAVLIVVLVGVTVVAMAVSSGDFTLASLFDTNGHVCTSTCWI